LVLTFLSKDIHKIEKGISRLKSNIFYGAGRYAFENLRYWKQNGLIPVCFADADANKWHTVFDACSLSPEEKVEILPLAEAVKRYPDYEIYVTVMPLHRKEIVDYLTQNGIMRELIKYPEFKNDGVPKYCDDLGNLMVLTDIRNCGQLDVMACCFMGTPGFQSTGDFESDYSMWCRMSSERANDLEQGLGSSCIGCPRLKSGVAPDKPKFRRINLSTGIPGGTRCNLLCRYCTYKDMLRNPKKTRGYNVLDVLNWIAENVDAKPFHIDYAAGEITVSPYCDDILTLWKKSQWQGRILSNCVIFSQGIADLLRDGLIKLNCSLDAGTTGTYANIKTADCFVETVSNLKRYASPIADGRSIQLKYVVLRDLNDNEADIKGFCEIARELGAEVILSRDLNDYSVCLSERECEMMRLLLCICKNYQLPVIFDDSVVRTDEIESVKAFFAQSTV